MALAEKLLLKSGYQPLSLLTGWAGTCQANARLRCFSRAYFSFEEPPVQWCDACSCSHVHALRGAALPRLCPLLLSREVGPRGVRVH